MFNGGFTTPEIPPYGVAIAIVFDVLPSIYKYPDALAQVNLDTLGKVPA